MGAIGGLFGTAGGANGTGFASPEKTPIVNPTTMDQINQSYTGAQGSLTAQQQLLQALQAQNGMNNQSQVYNQLQGVANGTGPNPAQAMLNQSTGANVANQASLMAGQRGAGANVGLIGRQASMQGANIQQQAAQQAATLQANQSLNAINSAGGIANNQVNNQIGQTNANTQAQQAEQQALINAQAGVNSANVSSQGNVNSANAGLANTVIQGQQGAIGGALQGVAAGLGLARGGEIQHFDLGSGLISAMPGYSAPPAVADQGSAFQGQSKFGKFLSGVSNNAQDQIADAQPTTGAGQLQSGMAGATEGLVGLLKGKSAIPLEAAEAHGGDIHDYRSGGKVNAKSSGEKAVVHGDNYANDKIPAVLSEHEIVLPRTVTMGKDPINDSAKFVAAVLAKRRGKA